MIITRPTFSGAGIERLAELRQLPAAPAGTVYSGVLYEALGLSTADADIVRRAEDAPQTVVA